MRKRAILLFSLVTLASLLLSACGGVIDEQADPLLLPDSSNNNTENIDPQPNGDSPVQPPATDVETQPETPVETPVVIEEEQPDEPGEDPVLPAKPTLGYALGDSQLVATDPNGINLSSGQPKLVELFAFW